MKSANQNQKTRMIKLLASGQEISVKEARRRAAIANPSAVVSELRAEGYVIWTNTRRDTRTGKTVYAYRYDASHSANQRSANKR